MKKYEKDVYIVKCISGPCKGVVGYWSHAPSEASPDYRMIGKGMIIGEIEETTSESEIAAIKKEIEVESGRFQQWKAERLVEIGNLKSNDRYAECNGGDNEK